MHVEWKTLWTRNRRGDAVLFRKRQSSETWWIILDLDSDLVILDVGFTEGVIFRLVVMFDSTGMSYSDFFMQLKVF